MTNEHDNQGAREALVEQLAEAIEDVLSDEYGTFLDGGTPSGIARLVSAQLAPLVVAQVEAAVSVVRAERDAEVEHWKHHAWEAGEGFKRAIEDFNRANARYRALREGLEALAHGWERAGDDDGRVPPLRALLAPSPAEESR